MKLVTIAAVQPPVLVQLLVAMRSDKFSFGNALPHSGLEPLPVGLLVL